ncbi:hypothetical protein IZY60_13260 [Lutibacter sp. B2]|nr:hypothetical protein [Lutibacter sp. B2]
MKSNDIYDFFSMMDFITEQFEANIKELEFYRNIYLHSRKFEITNLDKSPFEKNIFQESLENTFLKDINEVGENFLQILDDYSFDIKTITSIDEKLGAFKDSDDPNITSLSLALTLNVFLKQKYIHNKMCLINLYIILDECLSDIVKAIGMYDSKFLDNQKVSISYSEIREFNNNDDVKECAINTMIRSILSGIYEKIKNFLNIWIFNKRVYQYLMILDCSMKIEIC